MIGPGIFLPDESAPGAAPVHIGSTFIGFRDEVVTPEAREAVQSSAVKVLSSALEHGAGSTGLVVGRVQSGKTLSYEGVITLARDNGFAFVVVISGISNPLLAQGESRLTRDLTASDSSGWLLLSPAEHQQAPDFVARELVRVRDNWLTADTPLAYKQTAVVFVLKNHSRIHDLAEMFKKADVGDLPVLIVDDEADQASLNTFGRRNKESTTYANLRALRAAIPNHYYLQYTATPQAPLLIAIQDALSPDFVRVLEPGTGYTGGTTYFESDVDLVMTISDSDLLAASDPGGSPPESLRRALQEFLIGAAHGVASGGKPQTRSMLVHPSRQTDAQGIFAAWIREMAANWQGKYDAAAEVDPVKLRAEFEKVWMSLEGTFPGIADFEKCWKALGLVFRNLDITEVNTRAGQTPVINWVATKFYILVGGQAIDRGFTVEGLTVTYMPRGGGTFTADTIQQRARFFGYKGGYLGLCRVHLEPVVLDAFRMYVDHERDMLANLREIESGQESLKDWKRRFLLDKTMRATRASVIGIPVVHVSVAERWITDRIPVREDALALSDARANAQKALADVNWTLDRYRNVVGWATPGAALQLLEGISAESLLGEPNFQALSVGLAKLADDESAKTIAIYRMRPGAPAKRTETKNETVQIFQGRSSSGIGYPGDQEVFESAALVTVQLHEVVVVQRNTEKALGEYLISAWRLTDRSQTGWLLEVGA